ncbi:stage III sporulation protein AG [Schinkia azotoformans MEV2011]|uniref:Stage III sporulation protein AG n=1 Tax=Schinkia azotoformans MEV2011 TaxID=1348973 RepID=A0A072NJF6_SCHAZ|nr:stage III sporulation protein AG [Schinkia azotoformans]KEF37412.1 stage III sporulation protein AG [Schinkia azotoformans MEV2011]MEC1694630.1 stage III sporulation protein AG [Schinkia azotoformans]MEC1725691.1 stage III sporulation protein AG [Schinkia azotoformans]MEC1769617.1 stage III sporulation protein AG [Schinkia azotoformans]MEC1780704.1 stage III sporulation protein AG [Schinkia azotoformans]
MTEKNKGFSSWLKKMFKKPGENGNDEKTKDKNYQKYLLVILAIGVAFMLISNLLPSGNSSEKAAPVLGSVNSEEKDAAVFGQKKVEGSGEMADYEATYENQLKEALEHIVGVEDVTVMINLDATETKVLEKNTVFQSQQTDEVDREGGKRKVEDMSRDEQVVIIRNGEQETPIVLKTKKPEIRGVLVVAKGAENLKIKQMIIEAVTRVLDVPNHRVSVLPKKSASAR